MRGAIESVSVTCCPALPVGSGPLVHEKLLKFGLVQVALANAGHWPFDLVQAAPGSAPHTPPAPHWKLALPMVG